ncbi:hypothetical protein STTU_5914 [Streptomyces sp. Tu6071]|nr:hypothetical protein STTU_5914 [Streptomyces sp. Tu6071]
MLPRADAARQGTGRTAASYLRGRVRPKGVAGAAEAAPGARGARGGVHGRSLAVSGRMRQVGLKRGVRDRTKPPVTGEQPGASCLRCGPPGRTP